jgi:hypothetical protein
VTTRLDAFDSDLAIKARTPTTWSTLAPLIWTGTGAADGGPPQTFTVPIGFVTDFATVPRALRWLILPYGAYTRAAVLHDWLLEQLKAWVQRQNANVVITPIDGSLALPPAMSRDIDGIFRRAMEDLGVWWPQRWLMWAAVRVGSLFSSYRRPGREFAKDAPRVFLIVLALLLTPVIGQLTLVAVVLVQIVLTLISVVRALTGNRPVK